MVISKPDRQRGFSMKGSRLMSIKIIRRLPCILVLGSLWFFSYRVLLVPFGTRGYPSSCGSPGSLVPLALLLQSGSRGYQEGGRKGEGERGRGKREGGLTQSHSD